MKNTPSTAGFFVLRTPLLSVETLLDWSSGLGARAAGQRCEPLSSALAADRTLLRERLVKLLAHPDVREAIFIASPSLDEAIPHWLEDPDSDRGSRAERALVKYFSRMCTRPTPFGLFAGISTGCIGKETRLEIAGRDDCRRHTRLDNDYLFALVEALAKDPALRETLRYRPNNSLSPSCGRLHFAEARVEGTPPRRTYHLVSAEDSAALRSTLSRATPSATRAELAQALVCDEIKLTEAQAFVDELIEAQLLVPTLAIPVTGPEPLPVLIRELSDHAPAQLATSLLCDTERLLTAVDDGGLGAEPGRYREHAETLKALPAKVDLANLHQVDLVKPAPRLAIGDSVLQEINRAVELLHRLGGRRRSDPLARFRDAFQERYEEREVPLLEVLNEEIGLGSLVAGVNDPSPLLRGVTFPDAASEDKPWGKREQHLLTLLSSALEDGREELQLDREDLEQLTIPSPGPLPTTFEVLATILAPSASAVERGDFRLCVHNTSGPPGARFLGRFCHADPTLTNRVQQLLGIEEGENPDAIYAEIVHLPQGRLGNVLLRPLLRGYEISYLGRSGAPEDRQIPASDLMLSIRDGRFVLRSSRLDRRVIPRLSSAHAFDNGLAVYRFLCQLQSEGLASALSWDWGPLATAPFLPRVRAGRLILAPQRWNLTGKECKQLGAARADERFQRVQEWRARRRLPRWIALADGDNRLPVDLENILSVDAFAHDLKARESATLEEIFLDSNDLCVESSEGHYGHEIAVPLVRAVERGAQIQRNKHIAHASRPAPRQFAPGSEWSYVKLYTSPAAADELLVKVIGPVTHRLLESGAATGWFFIRYHDPEYHIRWRLRGDPAILASEVRPAIEAAARKMLADRRVWRVQFDTYEREQERYGGPEGVVLAERLFEADSEAVLEILELLDPGDAGHDERWRLAFRGMDQLLTDLGTDVAAQCCLAKSWLAWALKDPEREAKLRPQLSERYRKERARLAPLLDRSRDHDSDLAPGLAVFRKRSQRLAPIVEALVALERDGRLRVPITELARSYVHMHVNRLHRAAQNQHELILYDFLRRHYQAEAARATRTTHVSDIASPQSALVR